MKNVEDTSLIKHDTKHPCYGRKCKVFIDHWVDGFFVGIGQIQNTDYVAITLSTEKNAANPKMVLVRIGDVRGLGETEIMGYYKTDEIEKPKPELAMCPLLNYTCSFGTGSDEFQATIVGFYSQAGGLQPIVRTQTDVQVHASWTAIRNLRAPRLPDPVPEQILETKAEISKRLRDKVSGTKSDFPTPYKISHGVYVVSSSGGMHNILRDYQQRPGTSRDTLFNPPEDIKTAPQVVFLSHAPAGTNITCIDVEVMKTALANY